MNIAVFSPVSADWTVFCLLFSLPITHIHTDSSPDILQLDDAHEEKNLRFARQSEPGVVSCYEKASGIHIEASNDKIRQDYLVR